MVGARKKRLLRILWVLLIISVVLSLVLYALRQNINLYFTPSQLLSHPTSTEQVVRLGGLVTPHSYHENKQDPLKRDFELHDTKNRIQVYYRGVLPALFHDGQGIIVQGVWHAEQSIFIATQVLAKHDASYHPPEV